MKPEQRLRLVCEAIDAGRDLGEVARAHHVPLEDLQMWASVYAVARKEAARRSKRRARTAVLLGAALLITGGGLTASAQVASDSLKIFTPNSPALASDVNWNFALLKAWVEQKVGATGSATVTMNGPLNANGGLTVNGNPVFNGSDLVLRSAARGVTPGRALVHTSGNGLAINYGTDYPGGVSISGNTTVYGTLTAEGRRTPSQIVRNDCGTASCTATCPTGTAIKLAFGFHGISTSGVSGDWLCGSAFQWKGDCQGQASCTVSTACGSSSIWLECW